MLPTEKSYINTLGMTLLRIAHGTFQMGETSAPLSDKLTDNRPHRRNGDFDEHPVHRVTITRAFYLGACQVTNAQYEQFDPDHKDLRGKSGFSTHDDEAVVFVSWNEATAFCRWLSEKEGQPYRLPTEAEWEYACRATTQTPYTFGEALPESFHKNVQESWYPDDRRDTGEKEIVPLTVGQTPPNAWGLYDMHGNVDEWCQDWYGPYDSADQTDPTGPETGDHRITRGGSHSALLYYLRSASRAGSLPQDKSWLIGFRVLLGQKNTKNASPVWPIRRWALDVRQETPSAIAEAPNPHVPYFAPPRKFVHIAPEANGPLFHQHNHDTALAECPNGDLLALWYSCVTERGRELVVAASRLRYGHSEWDPADFFWGGPDRNNHAPALWRDGETLYHFNGLGAAATWGALATVLRTSSDNGATWSPARLIMPEHKTRQMPVQTVLRLKDGRMLLPCDAVSIGSGGTAVWLGDKDREQWEDPGGTIAGIHAAVIQLGDGRLMAFGRGDNLDGKMPMSLSSDLGKTWSHVPSLFPPVSSGQRCLLLRLREGPIFFASFAGAHKDAHPEPIVVRDDSGQERPVTGLYAALSHNEGASWSHLRLISDDGPGAQLHAMDDRPFTMGASTAEPLGYISVCQSRDNRIHLISSRQHYTVNLAWLAARPW
jgi:formylglycine-generating enzyme